MKKETYTLTIEYDNGDKSMRGGLTQTRCYEILKRYEDNGWNPRYSQDPNLFIVAWTISTTRKKTY
jgi:hypothetical protein